MQQEGVECVERGGVMTFGKLPRLPTVVAEHGSDAQAGGAGSTGVRVTDVAAANNADVHTANPSVTPIT